MQNAVSGYRFQSLPRFAELQGIQNTVTGYQLPGNTKMLFQVTELAPLCGVAGNTKYSYRLPVTGKYKMLFQVTGFRSCPALRGCRGIQNTVTGYQLPGNTKMLFQVTGFQVAGEYKIQLPVTSYREIQKCCFRF